MPRWLHIPPSTCTPGTFEQDLPDGGEFPTDDTLLDFSADLTGAPFSALEAQITFSAGVSAFLWIYQLTLYSQTTGGATITENLPGENYFVSGGSGSVEISFDGLLYTMSWSGNVETPCGYLTAKGIGHKYCSAPTPPYPPFVP